MEHLIAVGIEKIIGEETAWMKFVRDVLGALYTGLVVEGSGHWPHIDKIDEVAQAIKDFEDGC